MLRRSVSSGDPPSTFFSTIDALEELKRLLLENGYCISTVDAPKGQRFYVPITALSQYEMAKVAGVIRDRIEKLGVHNILICNLNAITRQASDSSPLEEYLVEYISITGDGSKK